MENKAVYISGSRLSFLGVKEVLKSLQIDWKHSTVEKCETSPNQFSEIDLVIFDLEKSNIDLGSFKKLLDLFQTKVLVITHDLSQAYLKALFQHSFESCLTKDCSEEELLEAASLVLEGKKFYCNNVLTKLVDKGDHDDCDASELSDREVEIVRLIAEGKTSKVIADTLFISPHTVNTHRKNIMKKIGVKNSSEVVMYATKKRLL